MSGGQSPRERLGPVPPTALPERLWGAARRLLRRVLPRPVSRQTDAARPRGSTEYVFGGVFARSMAGSVQHMRLVRTVLRPVGYLLFVTALAALSTAARMLGERDELGFFSSRLASTLWRYPEVTRPGVRAAWLTWALLFAVAVSPLDPIASSWDEVALGGVACVALWHHFFGGKQAAR